MENASFVVEHAKTARSNCKNKKCPNRAISKDMIRIARRYTSSRFSDDGVQNDWYHAECIFDVLSRARKATKKIEKVYDLEGFEELTSEEQEHLQQLINQSSNKTKQPTKKKASKPKEDNSKKEDKPKAKQPKLSPAKPKKAPTPNDDILEPIFEKKPAPKPIENSMKFQPKLQEKMKKIAPPFQRIFEEDDEKYRYSAYLICKDSKKISRIPINKTTIIGRGDFLEIYDRRVSRIQAKIDVDPTGNAIVTREGLNQMYFLKADGSKIVIEKHHKFPLKPGEGFTLSGENYPLIFERKPRRSANNPPPNIDEIDEIHEIHEIDKIHEIHEIDEVDEIREISPPLSPAPVIAEKKKELRVLISHKNLKNQKKKLLPMKISIKIQRMKFNRKN